MPGFARCLQRLLPGKRRSSQGKGLGQALLKDALLRTAQAADLAGIRAVMVHAISEDARAFYRQAGFIESPHDAMTLFLTLQEIRATLRSVMEG